MESKKSPVNQYIDSMDKQIREFYFDFAFEFKLEGKLNGPEEFFQLFDRIRNCIKPKTKYRSVKNLSVIVLYIFLKTRGQLVPLPFLLRYYKLGYGDFVTGLKSVTDRYLVFNARNKKNIVKSFITSILESFYLGKKVIQNALLLLEYFYPFIQFAKEEVNAAVICTLTLLVLDVKGITMSDICEKSGVQQSNLGKNFSQNIIHRIGIINYSSITKSSDLIRKALKLKVKLLEVDRSVLNALQHVKTKRFKKPSPLISKVVELRQKNNSIIHFSHPLPKSVVNSCP